MLHSPPPALSKKLIIKDGGKRKVAFGILGNNIEKLTEIVKGKLSVYSKWIIREEGLKLRWNTFKWDGT